MRKCNLTIKYIAVKCLLSGGSRKQPEEFDVEFENSFQVLEVLVETQ